MFNGSAAYSLKSFAGESKIPSYVWIHDIQKNWDMINIKIPKVITGKH